MFDGIGSLLSEFKKLAPTPLLALSLASATYLFMAEEWAEKLGVKEQRVAVRPWVGIVFLVSTAYLAAHLGVGAWRAVAAWRHHRKQIETLHHHLEGLTKAEKWYLLPYILEGENTTYQQIEDGVVQGLVAKGILYRASQVGRLLTGFAYNMQPWARDHLSKNRHLLSDAARSAEPEDY